MHEPSSSRRVDRVLFFYFFHIIRDVLVVCKREKKKVLCWGSQALLTLYVCKKHLCVQVNHIFFHVLVNVV